MGTASTKESRFLTIAETAELLRISLRTAYSLADRGEIPSVRVGGQYRVPRIELEEQLVASTRGAAP
jgi:excisionase family DNA binding protein